MLGRRWKKARVATERTTSRQGCALRSKRSEVIGEGGQQRTPQGCTAPLPAASVECWPSRRERGDRRLRQSRSGRVINWNRSAGVTFGPLGLMPNEWHDAIWKYAAYPGRLRGAPWWRRVGHALAVVR